MSGGDGTLALVIWPTYVGFTVHDPGAGPTPYGEPTDLSYERGQIDWGMEDDTIVGRAFVKAPRNVYTHLVFFSGPEGACMTGKSQLTYPLDFPAEGTIEVYPITNNDLRMNMRQGIDYT